MLRLSRAKEDPVSKRSDRIRDALTALDAEQFLLGVLFFAETRTFTDAQWAAFLKRCQQGREDVFARAGWNQAEGQQDLPSPFRAAIDSAFQGDLAHVSNGSHRMSAELRIQTVRGLYNEDHLPKHRKALRELAKQFDSLCRRVGTG